MRLCSVKDLHLSWSTLPLTLHEVVVGDRDHDVW